MVSKKYGETKNLIHGISGLLNAMTELSRLAEKYHLEGELYQTLGGYGKICELMGASRYKRFCKKNISRGLSNQEEWDEMAKFLLLALELLQKLFT